MASNLSRQFTNHLDHFHIKLEDSALNYLTSMLATMSVTDGGVKSVSQIRESTEMFLEEAEIEPSRMDKFYATLAVGPAPAVQSISQDITSEIPSTPSGTSSDSASKLAARRQKRAQKKAAPQPDTRESTPPPQSDAAIVATHQQSRFHLETLETLSKDIDYATVNISVHQVDLLVDAHLRLKEGVRYGLVGQNGVGKSVLMKCMADDTLPMPHNLNILHIAQLETFDESTTVLNEVLEADTGTMASVREYEELHNVLGSTHQSTAKNTKALNIVVHRILLARSLARVTLIRQLAVKRSGQRGHDARQQQVKIEAEHAALQARDPHAYITPKMVTDIMTEVFEKYELINLDARRALARKILRGLGFSDKAVDAKVHTFSGGWKMRIALAKSLFMKPDILLLDEPTNHLDLPAILWLQEYLTNETDGITTVVVSHDRAFLNAVTDETIIFRDKVLKYHSGNFDDYEQNTSEQRVRKQKMLDIQEKKRAKIVASIQYNVQKARASGDDKRLGQVASRKKKLDRLGMEKTEDGKKFKVSYRAGRHLDSRVQIVVEQDVKTAAIKIPEPAPLRYHGSTFMMKNVSFRYPGTMRDIVEDFSIDVKPGARIAFLGPNGCGKSTLLNLMTGVNKPTKGEVYHHPLLKIGYFSQQIVDQLDLDRTPFEELMKRHPGISEHDCRAHFSSVGVSGDVVLRKTQSLSGGQRNRVAFAMILYESPHVLVLDEITNHLDMGTLDTLVEALAGYTGALVLVSHDVWFLKQLMEEEEGEEIEEEDVPDERAFYVVRNGAVRHWEKGMDGYVELVMKKVKKDMNVT
ncbi:P-loop containing nucleoside triphosphate hydrolase protein [Hygrophoropsis aurantiaca]|uniref:P-loop containing nucleoside triphosphate hydrolase protein n=1 Tax=Hygrophoropsis aurantiaca TaxID=72124 RepID=A0ACB8A691_9AGAM|nr:P-loop containing nucleoside triphosphate hydrolase protein [Hygrophoropsis aurantiaca]